MAFVPPVQPGPEAFTCWRNPTKEIVKVPMFAGTNEAGITGRFLYVWAPAGKEGDTLMIPSKYDRGIHQTDKGGRKIGGGAPQLVRVKSLTDPTPLDETDLDIATAPAPKGK